MDLCDIGPALTANLIYIFHENSEQLCRRRL